MKKGHWILVVIGLLLVVGWFYWFQYRPSHIAKYCSKWATDETGGVKKSLFWAEKYDKLYSWCLNEQGLK